MKKIISIFLIFMICISVCACSDSATSNNDNINKDNSDLSATTPKIELTKSNLSQYISISGTFTNSRYEKGLLVYTSYSTIDLSAYGIASGSFDNVKITLRANIDSYNIYDWHLSDEKEGTPIEITISMPSSGNFKQTYDIECDSNTSKLKGNCDFTIVSVSGTFTPN